MANNTTLTNAQKQRAIQVQKLKKICEDPVLWAKAFLTTVNNKTKKQEPWTARWYQAEMLRDPSIKKVARCGRRTGKSNCPFFDKLLGTLFRQSAANC